MITDWYTHRKDFHCNHCNGIDRLYMDLNLAPKSPKGIYSALYRLGGLEHEFYFSIQLGISSSQLTHIFQRDRLNHPPVFTDFSFPWFPEPPPRLAFVGAASPLRTSAKVRGRSSPSPEVEEKLRGNFRGFGHL